MMFISRLARGGCLLLLAKHVSPSFEPYCDMHCRNKLEKTSCALGYTVINCSSWFKLIVQAVKEWVLQRKTTRHLRNKEIGR